MSDVWGWNSPFRHVYRVPTVLWGPVKPLPSIQEMTQLMINDLAERGIRLVVPGFETPAESVWPYGVPHEGWTTTFVGEL